MAIFWTQMMFSFQTATQFPNGYGYLNGTSMAAPHVAGLASLAWSYRPDLSYLDIKNAIIHGGDALASLSGKTVS
jgi:serine protease